MPGNPAIDYEYELINFSANAIDGTSNWWNTVNSSDISTWIYDYSEDASCGVVLFDPFLLQAP